jgi:hypothetical protein
MNADPDPAAIDWLHRWERLAQDPGFGPRLLEARPTIAPGVEIEMSHRAEGGRLRAVLCRVSVQRPFLYSLDGSPGLALLFERCEGSRTFAALHQEMASAGVVSADAPVDEFLGFARSLVGGGVLEIAEHPIPRP